MSLLTRRGFLAATSASAATLLLPAQVRAQSTRMTLSATSRTIEVQGKAATVWGLLDGNGRSGLVFDPGQTFAVDPVSYTHLDVYKRQILKFSEVAACAAPQRVCAFGAFPLA